MVDTLARAVRADGTGGNARVHVQRFAVPFEYPVYFTHGLFDPDNPILADVMTQREPERRHRFAVVVEEGVTSCMPQLTEAVAGYGRRHADRVQLAATPEVVPGGEAAKNDPALVERLQRRMLDLGMDRHSYVVAIGGGALLDLAGYVAATTHRGLRLIRVPTTVLSQNDSGVGVKNGVNAFGVKNFLGVFAPPFAVLNDLELLSTLSPRDKIAGMAEAVKVALIRDAAFFGWLEARADDLARFEPSAMAGMIERCAELHLRHIATGGDPFEFGSARPLDFGHWSAHKLEMLTAHALRHGEAVAIGIALDSRYSAQTGHLAAGADERICALLERLGFRLWHPALERQGAGGTLAVLDGLREFREHLGGELTVTLLAAIGCGVEVNAMDEDQVLRAAAWLKDRDRRR